MEAIMKICCAKPHVIAMLSNIQHKDDDTDDAMVHDKCINCQTIHRRYRYSDITINDMSETYSSSYVMSIESYLIQGAKPTMSQNQPEPNKVISAAKYNAVVKEHAMLTQLLSSIMRFHSTNFSKYQSEELLQRIPGLQEWWKNHQALDRVQIADEIHGLLGSLEYEELLDLKKKIGIMIPTQVTEDSKHE